MHTDNRTIHHTGIQADAGPVENIEFDWYRGDIEPMHRPALRLPVVRGILGIQPHLDRMPTQRRRRGGQFAACRDFELSPHQIQSGGAFGDRMFHLQPGIHLQEEELAHLVGEEFHRPGTGVADRTGRQLGRLEQPLAHAPSIGHARGTAPTAVTAHLRARRAHGVDPFDQR